jgi:hypothetical protein
VAPRGKPLKRYPARVELQFGGVFTDPGYNRADTLDLSRPRGFAEHTVFRSERDETLVAKRLSIAKHAVRRARAPAAAMQQDHGGAVCWAFRRDDIQRQFASAADPDVDPTRGQRAHRDFR